MIGITGSTMQMRLRTMHLNVHGEWSDAMQLTGGAVDSALTYALTYMLNLDVQDHVDISIMCSTGELSAYYSSREHNRKGFLMVGIYYQDEKRYSWHS